MKKTYLFLDHCQTAPLILAKAIGFVKDKILACLDMILIPVASYYTAVIACIIINKHKFNNIEGVVNKMAAQVNQ